MNPIMANLEERILYEEDGFLVFNKPHDIPTSGRNLDDEDAVQYWLIKRQQAMVWAVHQLDADTSGVNIFVTRKKLVGKCQKALADLQASKRYLAVVHGVPQWHKWEEHSPIGYISKGNLGVTEEGKSAHSLFRVLDHSSHYALIEASIFTGRTHQIRIHLSHLGFPLVGEEWYRHEKCLLHPRQALHALEVSLGAPFEKRFYAPIANDFIDLMKRLGFSF